MLFKAKKDWSWKSFEMKAGTTLDINDDTKHRTADGEIVPSEVLALQITRKVLVPVEVEADADAELLKAAIASVTRESLK